MKKYLRDRKINASIINIHGSVELTPYIGMSDLICDLVSSGATLEANNLKEVESWGFCSKDCFLHKEGT